MTDDRATLETISEILEQLLSNQIAMLKLMDSCVHTETLFYTAGDMAAICGKDGIHRNTWLGWVREGIAPQPVDIGGDKWLVTDIKEWLKKKKKESHQTANLISE